MSVHRRTDPAATRAPVAHRVGERERALELQRTILINAAAGAIGLGVLIACLAASSSSAAADTPSGTGSAAAAAGDGTTVAPSSGTGVIQGGSSLRGPRQQPGFAGGGGRAQAASGGS